MVENHNKLVNERYAQEVAVHPVELPPTGSYPINEAGLAAHHRLTPVPDPWRLPPKQIQQRLGPGLPPRDWIELRNSDSPAKQKPEMANGANSVSGRISDSRPPPPPPPTSAPLPVPPQPPPKKVSSNTGPLKSATPPAPNPSSNSRVETMSRNKFQSDFGASQRVQNSSDYTGSRTSSPSLTDRSNVPRRTIPSSRSQSVTDSSMKSRVSDEVLQTVTSEAKGPAPQPPSAMTSTTQIRESNVGQLNGNGPAVTKQPQRSTSVSRGLQVEENDLIQFSEGQSSKKSSKEESKPNEQDDLNNGDEFEDMDDDTESARTADEQIDYLEGLEPCPCYAKCCLDSIISLFCVTLLG